MRCLISGIDGFLGANLAKRLLADGHEVTGAALNRRGLTSLDALGVNMRLEYGDITDAAYVERIVNAYEPEWVFHLAAVSIVRIADADRARAFRTNIMGTVNVLEACGRSRSVRQVVVASSDKAYGDQSGNEYMEDMPLKPTGTYEVSKACTDHIARLYGAVVTRCANLFGPGDLNWSRLVPASCKRIAAGESPVVHGGAWHYKREWLMVDDAVSAYITLAERGQPGEAYNVGSGETMSVGDIAALLASMGGVPAPVEGERLACYEIADQAMWSVKMERLGWQPHMGLVPALEETYHWYETYLKGQKPMRKLAADACPVCRTKGVDASAGGDSRKQYICPACSQRWEGERVAA